jgi:hypothetical protein
MKGRTNKFLLLKTTTEKMCVLIGCCGGRRKTSKFFLCNCGGGAQTVCLTALPFLAALLPFFNCSATLVGSAAFLAAAFLSLAAVAFLAATFFAAAFLARADAFLMRSAFFDTFFS